MTEDNLIAELRKTPFLLAPMAGITDCAFRSFMRKLGAGILTTELVSAKGLRHGSEKTRKLMAFTQDQGPIGVQIFGEIIEDLSYAAKFVEDQGADFVDLNFGCPVPKVVKRGGGSAILKDLAQMTQVLRAVKNSVSIPLTIKIRTGWTQDERNSDEVTKIAANEGVTWVAIHGRTRSQGYTGAADWDYIRSVKRASSIPIVGNGDIQSAKVAVERLHESGCEAVMIGRGALKNPWIFREAQLLNKGESLESFSGHRDFNQIFELLLKELKSNFDERLVGLQLKKLSAWYSHGYRDSASFRKQVFQLSCLPDIESHVLSYFSSLRGELQKDTSAEPFLMGGHG